MTWLQSKIYVLIILLAGLINFCTPIPSFAQLPYNDKYVEKTISDQLAATRQIDAALLQLQQLQITHADSALQLMRELYQDADNATYVAGKARILMAMGLLMMREKGNPETALFFFRKAYPYCLQIQKGKEELMVLWFSNMGGAYTHLRQLDTAMSFLYKGLITVSYLNMEDMAAAQLYYTTGLLYSYAHEYDKALFYCRKGEAIGVKNNAKGYLSYLYVLMASTAGNKVARNKATAPEAIAYLRKAEALRDYFPYHLDGQINSLYGYIYLNLDNYDSTIKYYGNAVVAKNRTNRYYINGLNGLGIAHIYLKNYKLANHYLQTALSDGLNANLEVRDYDLILNIYQNLTQVSDSLRDYKKAYGYKAIADSLRNKLNNAAQLARANQLEARYRNAEKDRKFTMLQLQLASAKNSLYKKNLWIFGMTAAMLTIILMAVQLKQRSKAREQRQRVSQLKALIKGEENERTRIGQQLHDDVMVEYSIVKMNLETLPDYYPLLSTMDRYQDIVVQLNQASRKLRQMAHHLMPDALLQEGLVSALGYFCGSIQQMTSLTVDFQHYGDVPRLPIDTEIIIYRIVQDLIQNTSRHTDATEVMLQLNYRPGLLTLTLEDNGDFFVSEHSGRHVNRDLTGIQSRLQTINGIIEVNPGQPKGTFVYMEVNI